MSNSDFNKLTPAKQIVKLMSVIYNKQLTTSSGGNISIKDSSNNIYITPASIDKGNLSFDDICCITENGAIKSKNSPSSELDFHKEIYRVRPEIKCIIHAHPPSLVAFSIRNCVPENFLIFSSALNSEIPELAKYDTPGSKGLARNISKIFKKGRNSVIMENHGAVVCGVDPIETLARFETLEYLAKIEILSKQSSNPTGIKNELSKCKFDFLDTIPQSRKYNKTSDIGIKVCEFLTRAYQKNYIYNSDGTISSRENNNNFLLNNHKTPYWNNSPEDLILLDIKGSIDSEITSPKTLHSSIYHNNPDINSIIIAQPQYLMTYGINNISPEVRTIPESWIFLKTTFYISFNDFVKRKFQISELVKKHNLILIGNFAVISIGVSVFEAYNRIEVAEFNAKSILRGNHSKDINILNKTQIEDLDKKYFK